MKQVKNLLGEKRIQYAWIDTSVGSERVALFWWFDSLLWGISNRFPLTNFLALPGSESVFGIYQGPPCVHTHISKPRWILVKRPMSSWCYYEVTPSPFLTSKESFCTCVVRESLPPSSCFYRFLLLWNFCPQRRNCSAWGPSISCLNRNSNIHVYILNASLIAQLVKNLPAVQETLFLG